MIPYNPTKMVPHFEVIYLITPERNQKTLDALFKEIQLKKEKSTTGAIGGKYTIKQNNKWNNEGRIPLFWFPHSNRSSTRVMTLAPFNGHQDQSPANGKWLAGRGGCTVRENQKIPGPTESSLVYQLIHYEYQDVACLLWHIGCFLLPYFLTMALGCHLSPRNPITMSSERPGRCRAIRPWCPRTKATVLTIAWARLLTVVGVSLETASARLVFVCRLDAAFLAPFCLGKKKTFPRSSVFSFWCFHWRNDEESTCSNLFQ